MRGHDLGLEIFRRKVVVIFELKDHPAQRVESGQTRNDQTAASMPRPSNPHRLNPSGMNGQDRERWSACMGEMSCC